MNTKALMEKRNSLKTQHDAIIDTAISEVRGLNDEENVKVDSLKKEIGNLDSTIKIAEERAKEEGIKVEEREIVDNPIKDEGLESERRALKQLIKLETDKEEFRTYSGMTTSGQTAIIPTHLYNEIVKRVDEVAPLWSKVKKLTPVNGYLEILQEQEVQGNSPAGFVGEAESVTQAQFQFSKIKLEQRRCGAYIQLTQQLINDSGIDIVGYSTDFLYNRLARGLERAMVLGTVSKGQFEGLESASSNTNVMAMSDQGTTIDDYMNMLNSVHPTHQAGCSWIFSREEFNRIALMKDALGHYYITRDVIDDKPHYRLFGHEILISDFVPTDKGLGKTISYFVNIEKAYAGMIKKQVEFKHISGDTQNSLLGTTTLMIDIYADAKIKNEDCIRRLKQPAPKA